MLFFSLVQISFAISAVYFGAKVAMSFGRDVRNGLFHQVTDFSAREVGTFGAPSLITRITNDVQQVQLLVVMMCTMAISAPMKHRNASQFISSTCNMRGSIEPPPPITGCGCCVRKIQMEK